MKARSPSCQVESVSSPCTLNIRLSRMARRGRGAASDNAAEGTSSTTRSGRASVAAAKRAKSAQLVSPWAGGVIKARRGAAWKHGGDPPASHAPRLLYLGLGCAGRVPALGRIHAGVRRWRAEQSQERSWSSSKPARVVATIPLHRAAPQDPGTGGFFSRRMSTVIDSIEASPA